MGLTQTKLNDKWFREFPKSAAAQRAIDPPSERVLAAAEDGAPVETGAYRAGLHIQKEITDRVVNRIGSDVDYAMIVEARDHVLTAALDAI